MEEKEEEITHEFSSDQLTWWEEYRDILYQQKSKSDDHFEKAITFITSGALGLTLTFHDKIVPFSNAFCVYFIATGWTLLVATLFVNLYSHYQSSKSTDATIDDVDDVIAYKLTYDGFRNKVNKRNSLINHLNKASIYLLGAGLVSIIIYVSINLHYGKTKQSETSIETSKSTTTQNQQPKSKGTIDTTAYIPVK
tara:strand:+ start:1932 stop:2516 length:585 start_codon:yes stop_codon:yes gene_type:complete